MSHSPLHSFVYVSTATQPFSPESLAALVQRSRERNQANGITGMMLYKDGFFLQALEGEKDAVCAVRERIQNDARHGSFIVLLDGPAARREFPEWTMGFKHLDDEDVRHEPDFARLIKTLMRDGRFSLNPGRAIQMLLSFTGQPV